MDGSSSFPEVKKVVDGASFLTRAAGQMAMGKPRVQGGVPDVWGRSQGLSGTSSI